LHVIAGSEVGVDLLVRLELVAVENLLHIVSVTETPKGCLEFRSLVDVESSEASFQDNIDSSYISTLNISVDLLQ